MWLLGGVLFLQVSNARVVLLANPLTMLTTALFVCPEVILVQAENHPVMLVLMANIQIDT
jgi:hypothetical protein